MLLNTIFYVSLFAALQYVLFSVYLVSIKKGNIISNRIFAIFLLVAAIKLVDVTFFSALIAWTLYFCLGPLIYIYTKSLVYQNFCFKWKYILHFLPYIIYSFIVYFNYSHTPIRYLHNTPFFYLSVISFDSHVLIYSILSLKLIRNYKTDLHKTFSTIEQIDLKWLKIFIIIFLLSWYIGTFKFILSHFIFIDKTLTNLNVLLNRIVTLILSLYVVFKGLKHPSIFMGIEDKPKYEKSNLDQDSKNQILEKLNNFIIEEKPYLNHKITLQDLSKKLQVSAKSLSQVINECLKYNFYDFINCHRVEEAKNNIKKFPNKTFLEILHDAGFNSKAVFNAAFKKHTGITPTEYKKSLKNSD